MLAYSAESPMQSGTFSRDLQKPATFRHELLDFISAQLPLWRDNPDRSQVSSEDRLTDQLCDILNSAARLSSGWDVVQFRTQVPDEEIVGRKIDIAPKPCGKTIWIEGRRHTVFDSIMPIECKRLPTPTDSRRDEREYVFSRFSTTGGIQRFKAGYHGEAHTLGAMIGFIQEETPQFWHQRTSEWISGLVASGEPGWTQDDALRLESVDATQRLALLLSSHDRADRSKIELRHLWLEMNLQVPG